MKAKKVTNRFLKLQNPTQNCTGEWVGQPKYEFHLSTHNLYDEPTIRMECYGILNVDFEGGGELEFACEITYNLTQFKKETLLEEIIKVAHGALPIDLEELFVTWEVFSISSPDFDLWKPYEPERLRSLLSKAIDDFSHKYGGL